MAKFTDQFGVVKDLDPNFVRDAKREAAAMKNLGLTREEIDARGGINASGYYGDSYGINSADKVSLTDAEYKAATASGAGGVAGASGAAVNKALAEKIKAQTGSYPSWWASAQASAAANKVPGYTATAANNAVTTTSTSDSTQTALQTVIAGLNAQITALTKTVTDNANKPVPVGSIKRNLTEGRVQVVQKFSDGSEQVIDEYADFTARDAVMQMFEATGLGSDFTKALMDTIDGVYRENVAPSDAQILNSIYNSKAYEERFAANKTIRERIASGKGRPGDRLLSPAEYIKTEAGFREILQEADLPYGFYDTADDFNNLIANTISVSEFTERVNLAKNALNNADQEIVKTLKEYYGLSQADLTAYLLDDQKAFDAINSRYKYSTEQAKLTMGAVEVGAAAARAGGKSSAAFAEEIYKSGKGAEAEAAFQKQAMQQEDYRRLMGLYGETAGEEDIVRSELALAGGAEVAKKTKAFASKERAKFAQRSAIDQTSLGKRTKAADV